MYYYHFKTDCQKGIHSSLTDARCTMKVFMEGYTKMPSSTVPNFDQQINLNSQETKHKKLWCPENEDFRVNCKCVACKIVINSSQSQTNFINTFV